jgi:hypothetical protein
MLAVEPYKVLQYSTQFALLFYDSLHYLGELLTRAGTLCADTPQACHGILSRHLVSVQSVRSATKSTLPRFMSEVWTRETVGLKKTPFVKSKRLYERCLGYRTAVVCSRPGRPTAPRKGMLALDGMPAAQSNASGNWRDGNTMHHLRSRIVLYSHSCRRVNLGLLRTKV